MLEEFKQTYILPFFLFLLLLLDGILMRDVNIFLAEAPIILVPRLFFMGLLIITYYRGATASNVIVTAFLGLIYDSFYTGILGVNLFVFPISVVVMDWLSKQLPKSIFNLAGFSLVIILMAEIVQYIIFAFLGVSDLSFGQILLYRTLPSILLNILLFIILHLIVKKLLRLIK